MGVTGSAVDPLGTRHDMTATASDSLREIDGLKNLIAQLGQLPFQKTVLLLGNGLTRPPDQLEYWDSMIHAAIKGGVTFYTADVYDLGVCQDDPNTAHPGDCLAPSTATARAQAMLGYSAGLSAQQGPTSWQGYTVTPTAPGGKPTTPEQIAAQAAWYQQHPGGDSDVTLNGLVARTMEQAHEDDYVEIRRFERQPAGDVSANWPSAPADS